MELAKIFMIFLSELKG